jgi:alpha-2-macroglobulin
LPGEKVNLSVLVNDSQGKPSSAEVSIAVADLSVLALKGNPKEDLASYFFGYYPLNISTFSNLKHVLFKLDVPNSTKGGGGGNNLSNKKRGVFKDTAFYIADLETDEQGKANVSFDLPDNLTTWQIEAVSIDNKTRLGTSYSEFKTQKDIMITSLKPRFILPGDEFSIGAKVYNNTEKSQELEVSYQSEFLALKNERNDTKKIRIKANSEETIYFKVIASQQLTKGTYVFSLIAKNETYIDEVEEKILINRDDTEEQTATMAISRQSKLSEYLYIPEQVNKDKGGLTVRASATPAVFLTEGVSTLFMIPEGSTQDILEIVSSLSVLKKGLRLENIQDGFNFPKVSDEKDYALDDLIQMGIDNLMKSQLSDGVFLIR